MDSNFYGLNSSCAVHDGVPLEPVYLVIILTAAHQVYYVGLKVTIYIYIYFFFFFFFFFFQEGNHILSRKKNVTHLVEIIYIILAFLLQQH